MSEDPHRRVDLVWTGPHRMQARNRRGVTLDIGTGETDDFTPVELLLVALAGCSALDVEAITGKRSPPSRFEVVAEADKVRDEHGLHLADIQLAFDVAFPDTDAGAAAAAVLGKAVTMSHDRLCTVSRTVELGTPVEVSVRTSAPQAPPE